MYEIKPFTWTRNHNGDNWASDSAMGGYQINRDLGGFRWSCCFDEYYDEDEGREPTLKAAKAAAFANWVARITPALIKI